MATNSLHDADLDNVVQRELYCMSRLRKDGRRFTKRDERAGNALWYRANTRPVAQALSNMARRRWGWKRAVVALDSASVKSSSVAAISIPQQA